MDKIKYQAVIMSAKPIHVDMVGVLGESDLSFATVKRWIAEFKKGKKSVDKASSGLAISCHYIRKH